MKQNKTRIITIDGPAGAGKTTVSKLLSLRLGCIYVDTGALYRGVAYEIQRCQTDYENETELQYLLDTLHFEFKTSENGLTLHSAGQDITGSIRTSEISQLASTVSALPMVREKLLGIQKSIACENDAVFEGRDMGTVVFPEAAHKFFLVADHDVRAKRRFDEMKEVKGENGLNGETLNDVSKAMAKRDHSDSTRKEAPLKAAPDAVTINSTHMTPDEVVEQLVRHIDNM